MLTPKDDVMLRDILRAQVAPPWQLVTVLLEQVRQDAKEDGRR